MITDDIDQVIVVRRSDPMSSVATWRSDSITLARLRPILSQLRYIRDEPCREGEHPFDCVVADALATCMPCQLRQIKAELFGEEDR